jgi:hypothetical protein
MMFSATQPRREFWATSKVFTSDVRPGLLQPVESFVDDEIS